MPNSRNLFETIRVNINATEVPALTEEGRFWLNNLPSTTSFSKETITQLTFSLSVKVPHYNSALFRPEIYAKILRKSPHPGTYTPHSDSKQMLEKT